MAGVSGREEWDRVLVEKVDYQAGMLAQLVHVRLVCLRLLDGAGNEDLHTINEFTMSKTNNERAHPIFDIVVLANARVRVHGAGEELLEQVEVFGARAKEPRLDTLVHVLERGSLVQVILHDDFARTLWLDSLKDAAAPYTPLQPTL